MHLTSTPSRNDYIRLHRALVGFLVLVLAFVVSGFAIEWTRSDDLVTEAVMTVIGGAVPVALLILVHRSPLTREKDPTRRRFATGAARGRFGAVLFGVACLLAGFGSLVLADDQLTADVPWQLSAGLVMIFWSRRFPPARS